MAVDDPEHGGGGFLRAAGLEDQRQGALQIRVLNGNGRDVAVLHDFQRRNAIVVHPAGARWRRDNQYGAGESAHLDQIGECRLRLLLGRTGRAQPGIDPYRLERRLAGKRLNIRFSQSLRDEALTGSAEILPRDLRVGTAGSRGLGRHGCARWIGDVH